MITCQASIQSKIKPATWLPGVRNFHSEEEKWTMSCPVEEAMEKVWKAAEDLKDEGFIQRSFKKTEKKLVIEILTAKAKWLDQLCFEFQAVDEKSCTCSVVDSSTGFLPLVIPLAPVLNIAFCWFPFGDNSKCAFTMHQLRKQVRKNGCEVSFETVRASVTKWVTPKEDDQVQV